ncbi:MAG: hypothetical protein M0Z28_04200 [Rhodospirillales bacterium]|nr:hypothetical protein [Rhodospirillales bacterium]
MSPRSLRLPHAALAVAALLPLAGCSSGQKKVAPVCPQLSLLQDAVDLTRFSGPPDAPQDARTLVLAARIAAVPAKCEDGAPGEVRARLTVLAQLRRGPAAAGDTAQVPYFIAVTEGDQVLSEHDHMLGVKFPPNADQVTATGGEVVLNLPVTKTRTAAAYHLYVGFRLTPAELAYNRQTHPD